MFVAALLCGLAVGVSAQSPNKIVKGIENYSRHGNTISMIERGVVKSGYHYRMKAFRTNDNYQTDQFSYNEQMQLVEVREVVRNEYNLIDSLFYNELGQMVRLSGWQLLGGEWQNVYYVDYGYNDAGLIASRSNYNNFDGVWELGGTYNYTYNEAGLIVLSELTMGGTLFQKVEYAYDRDGNEVCELWYSYDGVGLTPSEKIVTEYADGLKVAEYDSLSQDGRNWVYNGYATYSYNNSNDCEEYHRYDNVNREVERKVYSFDMDMTMAETLFPWHPELTRPVAYQNTHVYDREEWHSLDVDFVLQHVCDYLYEYEGVNGIADRTALSPLTVYPNPAHDYVVMEGLDNEPCRVEVFDALGRLVFVGESVSKGQKLYVGQLPEGCYVIKASSTKGIFVSKLLKGIL